MITSTFDYLQNIKPRPRYSTRIEKRIARLEATVQELQAYRRHCPKAKKTTLRRLIERYSTLLDKLTCL